MLSAHQGSDNKVLLFEPPVFYLLWFCQLLEVDQANGYVRTLSFGSM